MQAMSLAFMGKATKMCDITEEKKKHRHQKHKIAKLEKDMTSIKKDIAEVKQLLLNMHQ
jgi:hypothetical protein